jgi:hypothetical protein
MALQGLLEECGAQVVAELLDDLLHLGEAGAPGGALRAVEVVQQVFGRRLQHGTQVDRNLYRLDLFCHLELLSAVARRLDSGPAYPILQVPRSACKPCRAPRLPVFLENQWQPGAVRVIIHDLPPGVPSGTRMRLMRWPA